MPRLFANLNRKEFFNPSLIGIFTNPFFFIKRGIYRGIKANASYMKGVALDFGCGPKPYRCLFNVDEYVGLDLEESGHDHRDSQIDILYDGETVPFRDGAFDAVLCAEVLEHVANLDRVVGELYRVMRPNAHVLITVPFVWEEHELPHDYVRYTSFGIANLLEKQGFQVVELEKTSNAVETCFQVWNAYASHHLLSKNRRLRALLIPIIISPMTMLGMALSRLLPECKALYLNTVIVARK